jgi:hypothetical protein
MSEIDQVLQAVLMSYLGLTDSGKV